MKDIRDVVIKLWIIYCFLVFASTEFLSVFNLIDRSVFIKIYLVGAALLMFLAIIKLPRTRIKFPKYWRWYILLTLTILLPLLLIALYYPPNNYDSMTYHLPRVEHWIQNKNVEFYQTNNSRQLFLSPMAEYIILHWRLLVGEDYLVNLVQYVSMLLSVVTATLVVKEWGGKKITELLAAVLVVTIPMGIMQSTSTQNDYVTAFFTMASLYFYLRDNSLFLALSIALGIFTKSTFVIFVLPLGFYWFVTWVHKEGLDTWKRIALILFFTILINGPLWHRNYRYFGSMFGPRDMSEAMFNASFSPKYIISNLVRNIGTQIGLPNREYNSGIDDLVNYVHQKLGVSTNDQMNSWYSMKYITQFAIHEDLSGNLIILILFLVTGVILIFKKYAVWSTYLALLAGWIFFSVLLKWQPWHSRLELPFFVMSCPIMAVVLVKTIKNIIVLRSFLLILIVSSIPFVVGYLTPSWNKNVLYTSNRPLIWELVYNNQSRLGKWLLSGDVNYQYYEVTKKIKSLGVDKIILDLGDNSREYLLYAALRYENLRIPVVYENNQAWQHGERAVATVMLTDKSLENTKIYWPVIFTCGNLKLF